MPAIKRKGFIRGYHNPLLEEEPSHLRTAINNNTRMALETPLHDCHWDSDGTPRIVQIVPRESRIRRGEGDSRDTDYLVQERRRDRSPDNSRGTKRRYRDDGSSVSERRRFDSLRKKQGHRRHDNITDDRRLVGTGSPVAFDDNREDMLRGDEYVHSQKSRWVDIETDENEEMPRVRCHSPPRKHGLSSRVTTQERRRKQGDIKQRLGSRFRPSRQDLGRSNRHGNIGKFDSGQTNTGNKQDQERIYMRENIDWAEKNNDERYSLNRLPGKQRSISHIAQGEIINSELQKGPKQSQYHRTKERHGPETMELYDRISDSDSNDEHHHQKVICEETLKISTPEMKENFASIILCTLCDAFDGSTDLKSLKMRLLDDNTVKFSNTRNLYQFLKGYEQVFQIDGVVNGELEAVEDGEVEDTYVEDSYNVTAKPRLQLCIDHSKKAGSCTKGCESLHICKYYIMSRCEVENTGRRCLFGHDMDTEHNRAVMRKSLTHMFPAPLGSEILLKLKYRNSTTVPVVCKYYNRRSGCDRPQCSFLHICSEYIRGTCKAGFSCDYTHDIMSDQNYTILSRYGMEPQNEDVEKEIIRTLCNIDGSQNQPLHGDRSSYKKSTAKKTDNTEDVSDATVDDDVESTSASDWRWVWQTEDGEWTDVNDSQTFEQKFREYVQAKKMQFSIENKQSEINFATMKGRIMGETPLQFKRIKKEGVDEKTDADV